VSIIVVYLHLSLSNCHQSLVIIAIAGFSIIIVLTWWRQVCDINELALSLTLNLPEYHPPSLEQLSFLRRILFCLIAEIVSTISGCLHKKGFSHQLLDVLLINSLVSWMFFVQQCSEHDSWWCWDKFLMIEKLVSASVGVI